MQSKAKPFDDLSNLMTNALGAVKGVSDEVKAMGRARAESLIAEMDLVGRDEFEVFKAVVEAQRAEIAALKKQVTALSPKRVSKKPTAKKPAAKKATAKKAAPKKAAPKKATAKRKPTKRKTTR